jgi:hypothetical protein
MTERTLMCTCHKTEHKALLQRREQKKATAHVHKHDPATKLLSHKERRAPQDAGTLSELNSVTPSHRQRIGSRIHVNQVIAAFNWRTRTWCRTVVRDMREGQIREGHSAKRTVICMLWSVRAQRAVATAVQLQYCASLPLPVQADGGVPHCEGHVAVDEFDTEFLAFAMAHPSTPEGLAYEAACVNSTLDEAKAPASLSIAVRACPV